MNTVLIKTVIFSLVVLFLLQTDNASGWYDETHLAVAKAAGYSKWYNAAGADLVKVKAGGVEKYNHFFNNPDNDEITPAMVFGQATRYNDQNDLSGHLYGAILASLREYKSALEKKKYAEYHLAFCAHYITDLSQPLHNVPYDDFNKARHYDNDGIVNNEVMSRIEMIKSRMYPVRLRRDHFEEDLAKEIAAIAVRAKLLAQNLKSENRNMKREEAYVQLGQSASLLRAVLKHFGNIRE